MLGRIDRISCFLGRNSFASGFNLEEARTNDCCFNSSVMFLLFGFWGIGEVVFGVEKFCQGIR